MVKQRMHDMARLFGKTAVIAVVAFLASDEGRWVTGQTIEPSGGYKL